MHRASLSIVSTLLTLAPAVAYCQQAPTADPDSDPPPTSIAALAAPTQQSTAAPPAPPAVRSGLAVALAELPPVAKTLPTPPSGTWGVVAVGDGGGGIFRDSDSEAEARLGTNQYGIQSFGSMAGGVFADSDSDAYAFAGWGSWGLYAAGSYTGGAFADVDGSGYSYAAYDRASGTDKAGAANAGEYGLYGGGSTAGAYLEDSDGSGYGYVGYGDEGIFASGSEAGGMFRDSDSSGYAYVGYGDYGIYARASTVGGFFDDSDGSGYAYVAYDRPSGTDNGGTANAGEYGVYAAGSKAGGYFESGDSSGYAYIGYGSAGILANGDYGVVARGDAAGGRFFDSTTGNSSLVAYGTYKIAGQGSVDFIQNHPYDPSSVIVYAAPEGDEVATYTRGTARLVNGEATVKLGETFKWVTNPDIGLTAHLTPRNEPVPLAVVKLSTDELVVRGPVDAPDGLEFDYLVYGLRIGFEETSVVQEKQMEAYIPSMKDHRALYSRRPDLRRYNALERFKRMRRTEGKSATLDLSRAHALRDAIVEFNPAVSEPPHPLILQEPVSGHPAAREEPVQPAKAQDEAPRRQPQGEEVASQVPAMSIDIPVDADGNVYATSFRPSARDLASLVVVSEPVEAGDVLVIDPQHPGTMRLGSTSGDPGVVGIVAAAPGMVLGTRSAPPAKPAPEVEPATAAEPPAATDTEAELEAPVAFSGVVTCKVDASYGAIWPGDLLVTSPTPGHAMAQEAPLQGTVVGKALEPIAEGTGTIKVLVMLR